MNTVKPPQEAKIEDTAPERNFASKSVPRHLARGAVGFGLIIASIALVPVAGPATLLAAPLALIAFRGCPTCWMVGLAQTISLGRLERQCVDGVCTLTNAHTAAKATGEPTAHVDVPAASR
ncbi:hypothetical protein STRCI_008312 [Streptomyces cinnabarinus]|uniref:DUF2892 domain-containing protein n=1 Tax=Streptomyces cinnabarinus TaxID=67287 RepID=A0ABY7KVD7_9ACTN|nr:hypothetical protein [Streptomyces cinnabarinus]WAZ26696.1 hypothetical protein STRCI_008312 [Streptomyces cinnabarinus]